MPATCTWDVYSTFDGFGSYGPDGDRGGYRGKQGPEFLDDRLAVVREEQRMVPGANAFKEFLELLGPIPEADLATMTARVGTLIRAQCHRCIDATEIGSGAPRVQPVRRTTRPAQYSA